MTRRPKGDQLWLLMLLLPAVACGASDGSTAVAAPEESAPPFELTPTQPTVAALDPHDPLPTAIPIPGTAPVVAAPPSSDVMQPIFTPVVTEVASGCFDPASVPACSEAQHPPEQPVELATAQQLGAGYVFTALSEGIALARDGNDWRAVLFEPREEIRTIVLRAAGNADLEILAVSRSSDRGLALAEVAGRPTLLEFTTARAGSSEPTLAEVALPDVDAQFIGLAHIPGHLCLYGEGVHCIDEQGAWTTALSEERVLDIDRSRSLLLTESGQIYRLHRRESGATWEPENGPQSADPATAPIPVRYQRLNHWAAFDAEGYLLYPNGHAWLQCRQLPAGLAGTADGFWIDTAGSLYTPTYSTIRQRCKSSLQLPDFIGDADQGCGHSKNWVVLTKTTLLSITGALRCAIG